MRIITFIFLVFLSTLLPWYLVLGCAVVYAWYFKTAYELIVLAIAIDAYFGAHIVFAQYTVTAIILLISMEWAKPRFLIYNK
ncbi:MAG: hypothetical protein ACI9VM_000968 [Candidatus Azotimanducaceae bacterium]|jgi:hypothetical protein